MEIVHFFRIHRKKWTNRFRERCPKTSSTAECSQYGINAKHKTSKKFYSKFHSRERKFLLFDFRTEKLNQERERVNYRFWWSFQSLKCEQRVSKLFVPSVARTLLDWQKISLNRFSLISASAFPNSPKFGLQTSGRSEASRGWSARWTSMMQREIMNYGGSLASNDARSLWRLRF